MRVGSLSAHVSVLIRMALSSKAFSNGIKRSCEANGLLHKRLCLGTDAGCRAESARGLDNVLSSENLDSDDEQSCYLADQIRAKRRASTRLSFLMSAELSKAVGQYSDDEDDLELERMKSAGSQNIDCKLVGGNNATFLSSGVSQVEKKAVADSDKSSRVRCFDYLVGAIDEAWARYCDVTTVAEDEVYGYNTPLSVVTDDEDYLGNTTDITDYESDVEGRSKNSIMGSRSISGSSTNHPSRAGAGGHSRQSLISKDSTSGPRDSDEHQAVTNPSIMSNHSSVGLQALKDRLIKAKYYLQDLVESDDLPDIYAFWKRWDMIKYTIIELVEDDDDDDVIESTIEELENGRCYVK